MGTHEEAPPIPPRKSLNVNNSSNSNDVVNRITQKLPQPPPPQVVTTIVLDKCESPKVAKLARQEDSDEDEDSNPICGPAETISGIIVGEVCFSLPRSVCTCSENEYVRNESKYNKIYGVQERIFPQLQKKLIP